MLRTATLLLVLTVCATVHGQVTPGEILIAEMNCAACHDAGQLAPRLSSRQSPRLGAEGVRASPQWLRAFLLDPQSVQPGTLMPDLLHRMEPTQKAHAADVLTHFLVSLQPSIQTDFPAANPAKIARGERLYHTVGCVMCHAPKVPPSGNAPDPARQEQLTQMAQTSIPVGADLAKKYNVPELSRFLLDSLRARPSARMPGILLADDEAESIAMYLLREQESADAQGSKLMRPLGDEPFSVDPAKAAEGKNLFSQLNCAACHTGAGNDIAARASRPLLSLQARQPRGCLSTKPGEKVPRFELTDRQRQVILALLQQPLPLQTPLDPEQQIRRTLTALNCYACHSRDRRGGTDLARREYFTTSGPSGAGEEDRVPPTLTRAGARLSAAQIEQSLIQGIKTRPNMATRMPRYGEASSTALPKLFEQVDRQAPKQ